jgi:hypothetical protein
MYEEVKLKHLSLFSKEEVEYAKIMTDVLGFPTKGIQKYLKFKKCFEKAYTICAGISQIDILKTDPPENSPIKKPTSIDDICFEARMEIEIITSRMNIGELHDNIAMVIALSCFEATTCKELVSESGSFRNFKLQILNEPLLDMIGVFNWIKKELVKSNDKWTKLFNEVDSVDPDFITAGGASLQKFNVINTIKSICKDFNMSYKDAWKMSYVVVQTKALEESTRAYVQSKMTKIKERRMKTRRGQV